MSARSGQGPRSLPPPTRAALASPKARRGTAADHGIGALCRCGWPCWLSSLPAVLEVLDLLNLGSEIRREDVAVQAGTQLGGHPRTEKPCSCPVAGGAVSRERTHSFNDAARPFRWHIGLRRIALRTGVMMTIVAIQQVI
jgi:hypothetical protein